MDDQSDANANAIANAIANAEASPVIDIIANITRPPDKRRRLAELHTHRSDDARRPDTTIEAWERTVGLRYS